MFEQMLTLSPLSTMPEFFLPELPSDRQTASLANEAIEAQMEMLVELLADTNHFQWLSTVMDKYEAIAHVLDAYSHSWSTEQADAIAQRLQRQLIELEEYIATAPEDLWPRGS